MDYISKKWNLSEKIVEIIIDHFGPGWEPIKQNEVIQTLIDCIIRRQEEIFWESIKSFVTGSRSFLVFKRRKENDNERSYR
jgi:hypothetical protein